MVQRTGPKWRELVGDVQTAAPWHNVMLRFSAVCLNETVRPCMLQQGCVRSLLLHVALILHVPYLAYTQCLHVGSRLLVHILPFLSLAWQQVLHLGVCMGLEMWLLCLNPKPSAVHCSQGVSAACFTEQERVCREQACRKGGS